MFTIPGKIPIRIHPFFLVIAGLIGWLNTGNPIATLIWLVVIFFSVIIHEYGHALTARFFGQESRIDLVLLGGITHRNGSRLSAWKEFLIVLNGPLMGFALWGLMELILHFYSGANTILAYSIVVAAMINKFWTLVNLLPIQPLDGGRLLMIILESAFGLKGIKTAFFLSMLIAAALVVLCIELNAWVASALFMMFMYESWRDWRATMSLTSSDENSITQSMLKDAEIMMHQGKIEIAIDKLNQIRRIAESGLIYLTATQYLAQLLYQDGKSKEAYDLLLPIKSKINKTSLRLFHELAFKMGELKEAIQVGSKYYQTQPNYETALLNALACSLLGEAKQAVGWLQCAVREGVPNLKEFLKKREFDTIRSDKQFQEFEAKV